MIDAHHHIWRQADLPWLNGPERPRIFGPYNAIKRNYLIDEYRSDIEGAGITKSVYVQANWAPESFEDEVAWVQKVSDESGWNMGIVGYADFTQYDVRPELDRLAKYARMRGIRQQLHWHENPHYRFASSPNLASDPTVHRNIGHLADYGWSFDLQVFSSQMTGAVQLAEACEDVTFVLQHAGMLEDTSEAGRKAWRKGMSQLATCPNVCSKLSAFGTFIHKNDPTFIKTMIHETVELFGADRCLYGSNYPIEKLWTSYSDLFVAFRKGASDLAESQQKAIFSGTAARVYRL